jgi:hypothetical protein
MRIKARIVFRKPEEGGWSQPHYSGVKPLLRLGDIFTSCAVWGRTTDQVFEPGVEYEVNLEPALWEEYGHLIQLGMAVQLNDGSRIVATGIVVERDTAGS